MDFINSWRSRKKQWDKWMVKLRLGKFTLFDFYYDHSKRQFGIILFNLGMRTPPDRRQDTNHKSRHHEEDI